MLCRCVRWVWWFCGVDSAGRKVRGGGVGWCRERVESEARRERKFVHIRDCGPLLPKQGPGPRQNKTSAARLPVAQNSTTINHKYLSNHPKYLLLPLMTDIKRALSRVKTTNFKLAYNPGYNTHVVHHLAEDKLHPLQVLRSRELRQRKREGLWWHVTTSLDSSKSSVVRSWARRRLRNAFKEELVARGFDEFGRPAQAETLLSGTGVKSDAPGSVSLTGSVKLHVNSPLIAASFADLKRETGVIIDVLRGAIETSRHPALKPSMPLNLPQNNTHQALARKAPKASSSQPRVRKTSSHLEPSPNSHPQGPTQRFPRASSGQSPVHSTRPKSQSRPKSLKKQANSPSKPVP